MANRIIINDEGEENIVFFAIDEDFLKDLKSDLSDIVFDKSQTRKADKSSKFKDKYGFIPKAIIAYGDTLMKSNFAETLIPFVERGNWFAKRYKDPTLIKRSYKCYKSPRWNFNHGFITHIIHEDPTHAWKCAIEVCHNPKYGLLVKLNKEIDINKIVLHVTSKVQVG